MKSTSSLGTYGEISLPNLTSSLIDELDKNKLFDEGNRTNVSIDGSIDLLN